MGFFLIPVACPLVNQKGACQNADKAKEAGKGELFGEDEHAGEGDKYKARPSQKAKATPTGRPVVARARLK